MNCKDKGRFDPGFDIHAYDRYDVCFSGGKDSVACTLHLLDLGIDRAKITLHHHHVDGKAEAGLLWDWPFTPGYCDAFGKEFGIRVLGSWREGGITRHMLRKDQPPAPVVWENPDGSLSRKDSTGRRRSKECGVCGNHCRGCIGKFPQVTADLRLRWCSSAAKIEIYERMVNNSERYQHGKTLVITGERAEESAARSNYKILEPHRTDNRGGKKVRRYVDQWRPVHTWKEEAVWEIMERYKVAPALNYVLGFHRLSCLNCIFSSDSQWKSVEVLDPDRVAKVIAYEKEFGCSIHRTKYLEDRLQSALPYANMNPLVMMMAMSPIYTAPIIADKWELPAGAFAEDKAGPS